MNNICIPKNRKINLEIIGKNNNIYIDKDIDNSSEINITSVFPNGILLNGQTFTHLWVNNNGVLTFNTCWYEDTPADTFTNTVISPFWADVATFAGAVTPTPGGNSTGSNMVYYDLDTANRVFTATWDDVGYYIPGVTNGLHNSGTDKLNAFQVQLIDRGASSGAGENFDIIFRYEAINWTTGSAPEDGGSNGLGGRIALAGWASALNGTITAGQFLPASGDQNAMLTLDTTVGNYSVPGLYVYQVRNGTVTYATGSTGLPDAGYGSDAPDLGSAYAIQTGTTYAANIDRAWDLDFYSFVAPTSGTYTFASTGTTDVIGGLLTSPDFTGLVTYDDDSGGNLNFRFQSTLTAGQTYYLGVSAYRGGTGAYNFSITPGSGSGTGTAISGGPDFGSATAIQTGVNYTESTPGLLSGGTIDLFQFTPSSSGYYTFASTGSLDMIGGLFSVPNMLTGLVTYDDNSGGSGNFSMRTYLSAGQTYYAGAAVMSGTTSGSYGFSIVQS